MRISDWSSDVCSSDLDEDQLVALDRRRHREADAGVARRRLDDGAAGLQAAVALGRLDHREADAILDRAARIAAFGLYPDFGVGEQLDRKSTRLNSSH